MRIISGTLASRTFSSPGTHKTHPMSERMRGALFNILGDISGLTVLDAFAGSGALALEAISRGAKSAVAVDQDRMAQKAITQNIHTLGLEGQIKLVAASVSAWLSTKNTNQKFDLILCDPPYNSMPSPTLLSRVGANLTPKGIMVLSCPPDFSQQVQGLELIDARSYGDGQLIFYKLGL